MESELKKIKTTEDIMIELIGIFKDGILSRVVSGKTKPLTYRISILQEWAFKDGIKINSIKDLIDDCNKYISNNMRHYEIVGRLEIKGNNIVSLSNK